MKKGIFVLMGFIASLFGCSDDDPEVKDSLSVSFPKTQFEASGGEVEGTLSSTVAWEISGKPEWVDFNPNGGGADVKSVKMTVKANTGADARTAEVKFVAGSAALVVVKVEQAGLMDLTMTADTLRFVYSGGKQTLELKASAVWSVESKPEWCTLSAVEGQAGGAVLDVEVGANDGVPRDGKVVFKMGNVAKELVVMQDGESIESVLAREKEVLKKFYNALNGKGWSQNYGWDEKTPVDEWAHVRVNDEGRVIKLIFDADEQGLKGKFIPELADLQKLEVLSVTYAGEVSGEIPAEWGKLKNLKELTLKNGGLTKLPDAIFELTNLEILNLQVNQLSGEISDKIKNLTKLTFLDLSRNQFRGSIDLAGMSNLKYVYLLGNSSLSGKLDFLPSLTSLVELNISDCDFNGEIPLGVGELKNLEVLNLCNNNLEGGLPKECVKPEKMRKLYVGMNKLKGKIPDEILNWEYADVEKDEEGNETIVRKKYDWTNKWDWEAICLQQAGFGFENAPQRPL